MQSIAQNFAKIKEMSVNKNLPARCRFMLLDLIELRNHHWQSRKVQAVPVKKEDIQEQIAQEAAQKAAEPPRAAVFPVEFDDASLQGAMQGLTPGDAARLANLQTQLVDWLNRSGRFTATNLPGDPTGPDLRRCDYCATDLARKAGTPFAVVSWVQKVSNLILNINLAVYDVATNTRIAGGSVDIRGDTDESWTRGLFYLLRNRIFVDTP